MNDTEQTHKQAGPWTEVTRSIRQLKTSWIEAGALGNPVLFFCHGFPDSPHIWSHQMEALREKFRVIAPYVRGCEGSEAADNLRRYSREAILLDHLEVLHAASRGNEPVFCVGHDLGAVHAMALAKRLGNRAAGLVVINGMDLEMFARRLSDPSQILRSWYMGLMQIPLLPEAMATFAPRSSQWLVRALGDRHLSPRDKRARPGLPESDPLDPKIFERRTVAPLNQYRAMALETVQKGTSLESRLKCPVLVIWGRDDGVLLPPRQTEWDLVAHKVVIRIIPGGHWLHRDEAEVITKLLADFVATRSSTLS